MSKESYNLLQKEVAIMKKIVAMSYQTHSNLVCLFEVIEDDEEQNLYLIMDYMDLGYLGCPHHLKEMKIPYKIPEEEIWTFYRECLKGLDYCNCPLLVHNVAKVIHCDIKPENILINSANQVKISDFGISKMIENKNEKLKKVGGTKLFLPPETWKCI